MGHRQPDNTRRLLLLVTLTLSLCLILSVGTALARYRYRETTELQFAQKNASKVYLWGGIRTDGSFFSMPADLTNGANGQEIAFLISNGESAKKFSPYTQQAQVRLLCSLGLGDSNNLNTQLIVGEETYTAKAMPIDKGSPIYASFGEGWAYCFLDENGNELRWELIGGQLSHRQMRIKISAAPGAEPSALRLMVSAEG